MYNNIQHEHEHEQEQEQGQVVDDTTTDTSNQESSSSSIKSRQIFVGGLSWHSTDESLRLYFESYGRVTECIIMKNKHTQRNRGFGFITFDSVDTVNKILDISRQSALFVDGKQIEVKQSQESRSKQPNTESYQQQTNNANNKIFIGGLSDLHDANILCQHFSQFGEIIECLIIKPKESANTHSKPFAFIKYKDTKSYESAIKNEIVNLMGTNISVRPSFTTHKKNTSVNPSDDFLSHNVIQLNPPDSYYYYYHGDYQRSQQPYYHHSRYNNERGMIKDDDYYPHTNEYRKRTRSRSRSPYRRDTLRGASQQLHYHPYNPIQYSTYERRNRERGRE